MTFDPKAHLMQLPRKVKDPETGQWVTRCDDYLEVKWRLVWFREKYPHGSIITEEMCVDLDRGYARFKAHVGDGEGGMATGTGTETRKSFEDFVEKAETRSIGRALAALGIGTQFVGEELSEGEHVADAPVATPATTVPAPLPTREGVSPSAEEKRPTAEEISTLVESARAANVDLEAFGHDMRRLMQLPDSRKVTKKFLREMMTMAQYNQARAHYGEALRVILEEDVPDHEPPSETRDASASKAVQEATGEDTPAVPSPAGSSSAPEPSHGDAAVDPAYHKLYQEALGWGVAESEIRHILGHHDLAKSRTLLWKARRNEPPPTWVAAD
jgi:hypothetical protein